MRLLLCCPEEKRAELSFLLFKAYWQEGYDFRDPSLLDSLCQNFGIEKERYLQADIKALLRTTTEAAAQGIFGVPTFEVDGELWWGQDRLLFVQAALGKGQEKTFQKRIPSKIDALP